MELTFSQIKDITLGAVRVVQEENGVQFRRFSAKQEAHYLSRSEGLYLKTKHTSGIQLRFRTDSTTLRLAGVPAGAVSRFYYAVEVQVDGKTIGTVDNYSHVEMPASYASIQLPAEPFDRNFDLGIGEKEVAVYLPWNMYMSLSCVAVDDGAFIAPVKPKYQMLCFGDSITQGYDAQLPSNKYVTQLAQYLEAEEHNKAIGGDWFFPELVLEKEDFKPDYISVAYGTNDWSRYSKEMLSENCKAFFTNIHSTYPDAKVIVITPIWRKDKDAPGRTIVFEDLEGIIADAIKGYDNMVLIPGYDLVPHDESYFADLRLHPNDKGFACYFEGIKKALQEVSKA